MTPDDALPAVLDALDAGRPDQAFALGAEALRHDPGDARLWGACGIAARLIGRVADAEHCWRRSLALRPAPDLNHRLAALLAAQGRHAEAETQYRAVLEHDPGDFAALTNLGLVLEEQRCLPEAEACQRRALALAPHRPEIHNHLAGVLARKHGADGSEAEAELHYREAHRLAPDDARHLSNLGALFFDLGRTREAETTLRAALALDPGLASAHINLGQLLLSLGRLPDGFRHTALRYRLRVPGAVPGFPDRPPAGAARPWQGQPLAGRRLLVWPEQGHGDQLQFCRFLQVVRGLQAPACLTFACSDALLPLLQGIAGADAVIALDDAPAALATHDYWAPLLGLPLFCGTTLETIPAATPYLAADPPRIAHWAPRLPAGGARIGLVWRGNLQHDNDRDRSLPGLSTLAPLWQVPGVRFVSLQKWAGEDEARTPPSGQPLVHLGSDIESFADTAAILSQLDLLISVDTAACHLAGALGIRCWVMLPAYRNDWRWLRDRADTPWYPGTRLFRQARRGDWAPVVDAMRQALQER